MTTVLSRECFHQSVGAAFNELRILEQISQLPAESILRVLQSIPEPLLAHAMAGRQALPPPKSKERVEQRAFLRRKVLRGARLLRGGQVIHEVQVRDISDGGCRIWSRTIAEVPDMFSIRIVGVDGVRACEVRWRSAEELGVRFLGG